MHELKLKNYFEGRITPEELNLNLIGSAKAAGEKRIAHWIENMEEEFVVQPRHILQLCKDVLNDKIEAQHLESIAFCIFASDNFHNSEGTERDDVMRDILHEWTSPEINYPLNKQTIQKCLNELEKASDKPGSAKEPEIRFLFSKPTNNLECIYFKCLGDINELYKYRYIEFNPPGSKHWIGCFERGLGGFDGLCQHPNKEYYVIVAGGEGYIVNPKNGQLITNLGNNYLEYFPRTK